MVYAAGEGRLVGQKKCYSQGKLTSMCSNWLSVALCGLAITLIRYVDPLSRRLGCSNNSSGCKLHFGVWFRLEFIWQSRGSNEHPI